VRAVIRSSANAAAEHDDDSDRRACLYSQPWYSDDDHNYKRCRHVR